MPLMSVIIPAHDEEKYIARAIKSVKRQTHKDYEIIVVAMSSRIREVDGRKTVDFKEILRQKVGFELNFEITDIGVAERFLKKLDFEEAFTVAKKREKYKYKDFTICLDDVEKLGLFIEIEKTLDSDEGSDEARNECIAFLSNIAPDAKIENRKYGDLMQELKNKEVK